MKVSLEHLLTFCEFVGGAVPPPLVVSLCKAIRQYSGLLSDMAIIVHDRANLSGPELNALSDRMSAARSCDVPVGPPGVTPEN